jgi:oligopeptide/dipeptide ABC transporter ATP-binding protein
VSALLEVVGLEKHFPVRRGALQRPVGAIRAVDGVSFEVGRRQTLALVGESGCGKTTTARAVVRLAKPTAGRVVFGGMDLGELSARELRALRPRMQMIFQDPYASLDPRMSIGRSVGEPLLEHTTLGRAERRERVGELLGIVGLDPSHARRSPHEFSGGQRQRIGIARALALEPDLIVCDEPISALDVSIQAQIVNLLEELQDRLGLTYLFISHDLRMVRHLSDRVAVMYLGKIVEMGAADALFERPQHPYTKALFSSVGRLVPSRRRGGERIVLAGDPPSPASPPPGCRFSTRCPYAEARCRTEEPLLRTLNGEHEVACHLV